MKKMKESAPRKLECPKCHGDVRQQEHVDMFAFCDTCKEFVYVGDQFLIDGTESLIIGLKKKVAKQK